MSSFTNAKVFTGTGDADFAEAFTVTEGMFTWVGAAADLTDPDAVDLHGATVLPGLLDVHQHPSMLAELVDSVVLLPPAVGSVADMLDVLRTHPNLGLGPDAWVEGFGYNESDYPDGAPTRADLDRVSTTQPVYCLRADVHTAVCNSYLLDLAGITADTPDPEGARFGREPDGTPNGPRLPPGAEGGRVGSPRHPRGRRRCTLPPRHPHHPRLAGAGAGPPTAGSPPLAAHRRMGRRATHPLRPGPA